MPSALSSLPLPSPFTGLWIPLVTPFRDGAVDFPALTRLVQQLRGTGITGFVACGSTGEAAALDASEQLAVLDTVIAAADGLPVVMGVSGEHLPHTVARVRQLSTRPAQPIAGLLVPAPNYIRPSQTGLLQWFNAIADASAVPILIYDIPYRTGSVLALQTLRTLAEHPRIVAIKDCGGDAAKTQALIADGQLQVLSGEDAQIFSTMALGGAGAIAASAHVQTAAFAALLQHIEKGDLVQARRLWQPLLPLIQATFEEPNPAPIKAMLAQQGWMTAELRAPMTAATAVLVRKLATLLQ